MKRLSLLTVSLTALAVLSGCYAPTVPVSYPVAQYPVSQSSYVIADPAPATYSYDYAAGDTVVANVDVMIRKGPGKSYQGCAHIPQGDTARLITCQGDWCKVDYKGTEGWSHSRYLSQYTGGYSGYSYVTQPSYYISQPSYYTTTPSYTYGYPATCVNCGYGYTQAAPWGVGSLLRRGTVPSGRYGYGNGPSPWQ